MTNDFLRSGILARWTRSDMRLEFVERTLCSMVQSCLRSHEGQSGSIRTGNFLQKDWSLSHCTDDIKRRGECRTLSETFHIDSNRSFLQCPTGTDKCQCCTSRLNARQVRFRTMVNEATTGLLDSCTDSDCRALVQSAQQKTLNQIEKINAQTFCQRYGYCAPERSSGLTSFQSRLSDNPHHHVGSSIESLDQRLEVSLSSDLCFQFGQMKPMCDQLMASPLSQRYANVYLALLKNNPKLVDDDLRAHLATKPTVDICTACKNAVQSSKDFWTNSLVRHSPQNTMVMMSFVCSCRKSLATRCSRRVSDAQRKTNVAPSTTNATTTSRRT